MQFSMSKQLLQTNIEQAIEDKIPRAPEAWVFVNDLQEGSEFDFAQISNMPLTVSIPILTAMADKGERLASRCPFASSLCHRAWERISDSMLEGSKVMAS